MKKSTAFVLFLGIASFSARPAFSVTTSVAPVSTHVTVDSLFSVTPSQTSVDYGHITPGGPNTANQQNLLTIRTNHNLPWTLSVRGFDFSDGASHTLPTGIIRGYTAGATAAGHVHPSQENFNLDGSLQAIYMAQAGELSTGGLVIEFNSFIDMSQVPLTTFPGTYNGNIDVILTDNF